MLNCKRKIWPWLVVMTAGFLFFYHFVQMNVLNSIGPYLMRDFSLNASQLGSLSATFFMVNLVLVFPAGVMLDRFSARRIILFAMSCIVGSLIGFSLAHTVILLTVFRMLAGVGGAFAFLACAKLASRWFPTDKMALVMGCIVTMAMLGGMVAQTPTIYILHRLGGWRPMLLVFSAMGLLIILLMALIVKDDPFGSSARTQNNLKPATSLGKDLVKVILNPYNWLAGLYVTLVNLPVFLLGGLWGGSYLTVVHQFSEVNASYAMSAMFVGLIIGSPLFGAISDYSKNRKIPMLMGALLSLASILCIIYGIHFSFTMMVGLFFCLGISISSQILSYPVIAELNPSKTTGAALGIASVLLMASGFVCQPLFGYLMDLHWNHLIVQGAPVYTSANFYLAMLILPIAMLISVFLALLMKETYCRAQYTEIH